MSESPRLVKVRIYRGRGDRREFLYGELFDAESEDLLVSASAKYVSDAIKERGYQIVELEVQE